MRNIFVINATQVVTSEFHPEGVYSAVSGYPKSFDSRNYESTETNPNGSEALALIVAKAEYADAVKTLSLSHNRAAWAVTLGRADGVQIARDSFGAFPDMTPGPIYEPEDILQ